MAPTQRPRGRTILRQAVSQPWVVYSKPPMTGPQQVLRYLGRYTHRIAISNERIVSVADGHVRFRYRDRRHGNRAGILAVTGPEFARRFLLHVLPEALCPAASLRTPRQRSPQRETRASPTLSRRPSRRAAAHRSGRVLARALSPCHRPRTGPLSRLCTRNTQNRRYTSSRSCAHRRPRTMSTLTPSPNLTGPRCQATVLVCPGIHPNAPDRTQTTSPR